MVTIERAKATHVQAIFNNLRRHDEELFLQFPQAQKLLKEEIKKSTYAFTGFIDGEVVCIWGIQAMTILNDVAYLWLMTTRLVEERPFMFVRHSQMVIQALLREFSVLHGWVLENNTCSINWLRWIGSEFTPAEEGILEFFIRRKSWPIQ